jgi:hypothetical protein
MTKELVVKLLVRHHGQAAKHKTEVSRKWFSLTDSYGIDIKPGVPEVVILAATVIVDQLSHEDQEARADPVHAGQDITKTSNAMAAGAAVAVASTAPMPQQNLGPLPQGWIQQIDQATGKPFFVNTMVNPPQTSWTDPRMMQQAPPPQMMAPPAALAPLPAGWVEQRDPATGKSFYVCTLTNPPTTTWTRPM